MSQIKIYCKLLRAAVSVESALENGCSRTLLISIWQARNCC
ncbi:hypothetical protein KPSA3_02162 [Pseudomonas syringae pv. actinidiae]|uniref:Uncharacterized protein n=1 Tax=Pseudomonas syringae pv. actinidiae TaxID=103796 RepID=A0AAN4Q2P0_PSESF|nr:hypothetical protein KPSA3_02162 [Pseudomonas syringae pv. actinidiae]